MNEKRCDRDGSGRVVCSMCEGEGVVARSEFIGARLPSTCLECNGSGRVACPPATGAQVLDEKELEATKRWGGALVVCEGGRVWLRSYADNQNVAVADTAAELVELVGGRLSWSPTWEESKRLRAQANTKE